MEFGHKLGIVVLGLMAFYIVKMIMYVGAPKYFSNGGDN